MTDELLDQIIETVIALRMNLDDQDAVEGALERLEELLEI